MHKEVFKNTAFQVFSRGITTTLGFLITILIARHFGVYQFGELSKIMSYVALFYLFVDFGLNAVFLKSPKSFSSLFYLRLFIALIIFIVANLFALVLPYDAVLNTGFSNSTRIGIFIFSFTLFAQSIIFTTSSIFQKDLKYGLFMLSQVVGEIFNLFVIAILIFFAKPIASILIAYVISTFLTSAISLIFVRENLKSFNIKYSKSILLESLPLGLMLIFNLIYFRIDILLLSVLKPNADVAIYSIAYRFFDFFIAIPLFLSNALYPKLLLSVKNGEFFGKLIRNYFSVYLIFSIFIVIIVWFFSPLFGLISEGYSPAVVPFRILIISLPIFFLTSFVQWVLISLNQQRFLMFSYFISGAINIALNIVLIPRFSYTGSAFITDACELFVFVLLFAKLRNSRIFSEKHG